MESMSKRPKSSDAFLRLEEEMNATSGQLRYDPISSNLYDKLDNAEQEQIKQILLEKLESNDERIVRFALSVGDLSVDEYVRSVISG